MVKLNEFIMKFGVKVMKVFVVKFKVKVFDKV